MRRDQQDQIRLGNIINIPAPDDSFDSFGPLYSDSTFRTILDVDAGDDPSHGRLPGSWVLTLSGKVSKVPTDLVPKYSVPIVARIFAGAGGAQTIVEIDAWQNVLAIPSRTCRVDIGYTQIANRAPIVGDLKYFPEIEITSTITKSGDIGDATPTRTFNIIDTQNANPVVIQIPRHASSWCFVPENIVNAGDVIMGDVVIGLRSGDVGVVTQTPLDNPSQVVVASMGRMVCFRSLPPSANQIILHTVSTHPVGQLVFRLGL